MSAPEQNTLTEYQTRQVASCLHEQFLVTPYQKRFGREAPQGFSEWRFHSQHPGLVLLLSWRGGKLWLEVDGPLDPLLAPTLERARAILLKVKRSGQGKGQRPLRLRFKPRHRPRLSALAECGLALPI